MRRSSVGRSSARRSYNERAGKTHRMNVSAPLRGGWRL